MERPLTLILIVFSLSVQAQLFDNPTNMELVRRGVDHIYNLNFVMGEKYIDSVGQRLPRHPVIPMMRALTILWKNIPLVTVDTVFSHFRAQLYEAVRLAAHLDGGRQEHPEAIFFEMSARGLLAEYYADDGQYMRAVSEATKAYTLMKMGFKLMEEIPEFLLTSGIYNYFREKYPERHPVYKPFMWLFRNGDIELGLQQLQLACQKAVVSRVEAYIYLSYIYLRYENKPVLAQRYLRELVRLYPNNHYIKTKYLESLLPGDDFRKAPVSMIRQIRAMERPYYRMAGESFAGYYEEKVNNNPLKAMKHYELSIRSGSDISGHGEFYRALAYLGLGRIYYQKGDYASAETYLNLAVEEAETEEMEQEALDLLDKL